MSVFDRWRAYAQRLSAISVLLFATGFAFTVAFTGEPLAMGYWLYNGWTEPEPADLPFPALLVGLLVLAGIATLVVEIRTRKDQLTWLSHGLGIAAMLVSGWHLVALVRSAAP